MTDISIVIPAYNAAKTLPATLRALESLDYDRDKFEIIVVDDGSTDTTPAILGEFQAATKLRFSWSRRDRSQGSGPGLARNVAIGRAIGRVIAFTDADCVPEPGWLRAVGRAVIDEGHVVVGGDIHTDGFLLFPWRAAPAGHIGVTANLAYDSAKAGRVLFRETFRGYVGQDIDLVMRLDQAGHKLHHEPAMRVFHPVVVLSCRAALRRALSRENEVQIHKYYGDRMPRLSGALTGPLFFGRISPLAVAALAAVAAFGYLLARDWRSALLTLLAAVAAASTLVLAFFFRIFPVAAGDRARVSLRDRLKTLAVALGYFPVLLWARIVGSIKFRHLLI